MIVSREKCHGEGVYLDMAESFHGVLRFCSCSEGERKRRDWESYNERVKAEAMRYRRKKRHMIKNCRVAAAGEKEDGNEVPF